ncbi:MAG: hypothetical protein ABI551_08305 [Polyangiaceae bacterium]
MDDRTRAATYEDVLRIVELLEAERVEYEPYVIRINDELTVDIMNLASGLTWKDLVPYRVRIEGVNVIDLRGLLRMKENGRLKDKADAEQIRKILESA